MEIGDLLIVKNEFVRTFYQVKHDNNNNILEYTCKGKITGKVGDRGVIIDKKNNLIEILIDKQKIYFSTSGNTKLHEYYKNIFLSEKQYTRFKKIENIKKLKNENAD